MPGQLQAVPGTNTLYAVRQMWIAADNVSSLWRPPYTYQLRGPKTRPQGWTFPLGYWPARRGGLFCNDPAAPASLMFGDSNAGNANEMFEPTELGNQGHQGRKFIMGQCQDSGGGGVSGAVVQGFRTSTDEYVGETTADSNGNYELGVPYPGENHYLVAYRAGSPDLAGTTVNNLQGTNRDGT